MKSTIYCSYPLAQYHSHRREIDTAIKKVLKKGAYILGEEVKEFEQEFAMYIGVKYAVGVNSGTDALFLSLRALNIGDGDEVIMPSHTAVATGYAVKMTQAQPVFVDIMKDTFTIDPKKIERAITKKTKAIIIVHIYGQPADISSITKIAKKYKLYIIEDCAQATGAAYKTKKVGSFGIFGCFSFYPTKNLGAIGDGGIITTNNNKLAQKLLQMRQYGWDTGRTSHIEGINSRLDEIQAAILRIKLKTLDGDNKKREEIADYYYQELSDIHEITLPRAMVNTQHVYHLYVIRVPSKTRVDLQKKLFSEGINTALHYHLPVHKHPYFLDNNIYNELPVTEKIYTEILSLPMYPELKLSSVKKITKIVKYFFTHST